MNPPNPRKAQRIADLELNATTFEIADIFEFC
jgi:hypothetical protein